MTRTAVTLGVVVLAALLWMTGPAAADPQFGAPVAGPTWGHQDRVPNHHDHPQWNPYQPHYYQPYPPFRTIFGTVPAPQWVWEHGRWVWTGGGWAWMPGRWVPVGRLGW